jgi:hypothetical protein
MRELNNFSLQYLYRSIQIDSRSAPIVYEKDLRQIITSLMERYRLSGNSELLDTHWHEISKNMRNEGHIGTIEAWKDLWGKTNYDLNSELRHKMDPTIGEAMDEDRYPFDSENLEEPDDLEYLKHEESEVGLGEEVGLGFYIDSMLTAVEENTTPDTEVQPRKKPMFRFPGI